MRFWCYFFDPFFSFPRQLANLTINQNEQGMDPAEPIAVPFYVVPAEGTGQVTFDESRLFAKPGYKVLRASMHEVNPSETREIINQNYVLSIPLLPLEIKGAGPLRVY